MLVLAGLFSEVELILRAKEGWRPLNNRLKVPQVIVVVIKLFLLRMTTILQIKSWW